MISGVSLLQFFVTLCVLISRFFFIPHNVYARGMHAFRRTWTRISMIGAADDEMYFYCRTHTRSTDRKLRKPETDDVSIRAASGYTLSLPQFPLPLPLPLPVAIAFSHRPSLKNQASRNPREPALASRLPGIVE